MPSKPRPKMTFKGRTNFPIDMLRYDCCYPCTQDSVSRIMYSTIEVGQIHEVTVQKSDSSDFTVERWKSFGWVPENEDI